MEERIGYLGCFMVNGKRPLELPDGTWELVDPDVSEAEIADRFALDEVVRVLPVELPPLCRGRCLDGPLAGQMVDYVPNVLGQPAGFSTGGWSHSYEVAKLASDGRPAELRHLESREWRQM